MFQLPHCWVRGNRVFTGFIYPLLVHLLMYLVNDIMHYVKHITTGYHVTMSVSISFHLLPIFFRYFYFNFHFFTSFILCGQSSIASIGQNRIRYKIPLVRADLSKTCCSTRSSWVTSVTVVYIVKALLAYFAIFIDIV